MQPPEPWHYRASNGQPASDDVELLDGYLLEFAAPLEAVAATLKDRLAM